MEVMDQSKRTVLLLFSICLLLAGTTQAIDVKYCDHKENYDVKVQGVKISPDPVAPGKPATFNISASTGRAISRGKVVIDVSFYGVHVHKEIRDLCQEITCPITHSDFVLSHTQSLPVFTPPGPYTLKMDMEDERGHQLTCFSFKFSIGFGSSVSDS